MTSVLARFGHGGDGCAICKPTVASILSSFRNSYVLDAGRGGIQETNDRALANMQKNGTYSVVPRIPAGEIPAKKLGVIAEVAEEFGLYVKITGAQRIGMFGARLEQLLPTFGSAWWMPASNPVRHTVSPCVT